MKFVHLMEDHYLEDYYLGLDVGATKTELCLISINQSINQVAGFQSYRELGRVRMPTEADTSLPDYLKRLKILVTETLNFHKISLNSLKGIGIGLPGSIDPNTQIMHAGSIGFFLNCALVKPFRSYLEFEGPILFDNDANCFALAEAYFGAGASYVREKKIDPNQFCMIGITLGTGVGGGLIIHGKLFKGKRGGAGEIGHTHLAESGRICYCGLSACAELHLSGPGLAFSYARESSLPSPVSAPQVFKKAEAGEMLALKILAKYQDHLVSFLSNLSNSFDPHAIVLGGGLSVQSKIYENLSNRLSKACFLSTDPPAILANCLGESAGVLGAALLSYKMNFENAAKALGDD